MKAWQFSEYGEPADVLRYVDLPIPQPTDDEIIVKVFAVALNFPDILLCRGTYQWRPELPFTPGLEVCGEIVAVGKDTKWQLGQRVFGATVMPSGGLAEYAKLPAQQAFLAPEDMSNAAAAGFYITYHSAFVGLHRRAHIQPGETLLVLAGAGGIGSATIQLGLAAGARVIAAAGGPEKIEICRKLGATDVIDYQETDLVDAVKQLTDGKGADVIWDPVGGAVSESIRHCIAFEGRIVLVGFAGGAIGQFPANHVLVKNYSVVGLHWGLYRRTDLKLVQSVHRELDSLYRDGKIYPLIGSELSLVDAPQALHQLSTRNTIGKVVLTPQ